MPLQDWIHRVEEGGGATWTKRLATVLAFVALAAVYDSFACREPVPGYAPTSQGFQSRDAMESAQLARNITQGKGYVTDSIRPVALYLLDRMNPGAARTALSQGAPDLSQPPVYPVLLAGLMKVAPMQFTTKPGQVWYYTPECWIAILNEALFFVAAWLLFGMARRLFDNRVAWLAALIFAGTALFWRFSVSGLSTMLLEVIFLAMARAMVTLEERGRAGEPKPGTIPEQSEKPKGLMGWALLIGALAGLGTLTRYSFGWVIIPAAIFCAIVAVRARTKAVICVLGAFLVVTAPWLARNGMLSGNLFGVCGYSLVEQTPPFSGETLEQSLNPEAGFRRMRPAYLEQKLLTNLQSIVGTELPSLGGNWLTAFFAVGLLIPFRNRALGRLRVFVVLALAIWVMVEALGRTEASNEPPVVNGENLLVILAPLIFAYGAGLVYVLVDQMMVEATAVRAGVVALVAIVACLPLVVLCMAPPQIPDNYPYAPRRIQLTARLMEEKELTMSDIPWAVAWYGERPCMWLTLNDSEDFLKVNSLKPVASVFLTQRTTDSRLLREITGSTNSWGRFFWDCWSQGEVPTGFPLRKAPKDFLPDQLLVSDRKRW